MKEPVYKAGTKLKAHYQDNLGRKYLNSVELIVESKINDALQLLHDITYHEFALLGASLKLRLKGWEVIEPPKQD